MKTGRSVYVIFIDFLVLGVLRFCFVLLSNVQFLVLVNLPPGLATRVGSYIVGTWEALINTFPISTAQILFECYYICIYILAYNLFSI